MSFALRWRIIGIKPVFFPIDGAVDGWKEAPLNTSIVAFEELREGDTRACDQRTDAGVGGKYRALYLGFHGARTFAAAHDFNGPAFSSSLHDALPVFLHRIPSRVLAEPAVGQRRVDVGVAQRILDEVEIDAGLSQPAS